LDQLLGLLGRLLCPLSGLCLLARLRAQLLRLLDGLRTSLLRLLDGLRTSLLRLLDGLRTNLRLGSGASARLRACWSRAPARPSAVRDDRRLRRRRSHNTRTTNAKAAAALPRFAAA
jgi:hypothetical protein